MNESRSSSPQVPLDDSYVPRERGSRSRPRSAPDSKDRRRTNSLAMGLFGLEKIPVLPSDNIANHAKAKRLAHERHPRRSATIDGQQHQRRANNVSPLTTISSRGSSQATDGSVEETAAITAARRASGSGSSGHSRPGSKAGPISHQRPSTGKQDAPSAPSSLMPPAARRRPVSVVPYPRGYEPSVIDNDVWEHVWSTQLAGSVTWHDFATPPQKVLDLGCGTGAWVLDAAQTWKNTNFVGLDIARVQPNLKHLSPKLSARIKWIHANFLEPLPFASGEFDFVHVRRIARGVPENQWHDLFEEIARILKPGGAFEIVEEDLVFPGSLDFPAGQFDSSEASSAGPSRAARPNTTSSTATRSSQGLSTHSGTHGKPLNNPHDHSELERIYTEMHAARWINLEVVSLLSGMLALHFVDVRSHAAVHISFPPPSTAPRKRVKSNVSSEQSPSSPVARKSLAMSRSDRRSTSHEASTGSVASAVPSRLRGSSVSKVASPPPLPSLPEVEPATKVKPAAPKIAIPPEPPNSSAPSSPFSTPPYPHMPTSAQGSKIQRANTLPNSNWNFDMGTLPLHLALRVAEVRGCSDAMWTWLIANGEGTDDPMGVSPPGFGMTGTEDAAAQQRLAQAQAAIAASLATPGVVGGWMATSSGRPSTSSHLTIPTNPTVMSAPTIGTSASSNEVKNLPGIYTPRNHRRLMTRTELNRLLDRFEMDMADHIGLAATLESRLNWKAPTDIPPTSERKAFDEMVMIYEDYLEVNARRGTELGQFDSGGSRSHYDSNGVLNIERSPERSPPQPPTPPLPAPPKLSRTLRAFVAWKATS